MAIKTSFSCLIPTQDGEVYYRCKADSDDLRMLMLQSVKDVLW